MIVSMVALHSVHNKEPIDAMIYCIVVALGFAALENTFFIMDPLLNGEVTKGLLTGNMRFIGSTLVHIVSSASIGFAALGLLKMKISIAGNFNLTPSPIMLKSFLAFGFPFSINVSLILSLLT